MEEKQAKKEKVTWKGWISLLFLIVSFSGLCAGQENFLKAFDLNSLIGQFGHAEGAKVALQGTGGAGAREGFVVALTLIPTIMLAQGLIEVCENMGALHAAEKLFHPLLHPLMGIPGVTGLAFVSSFTSSDVGAFMTKDMYEAGMINDDERTIFAAYQYAGSAVVSNTIAAGAPLVPIAVVPVGAVIGMIFVVKVMGANIIRFYLKYYHRKHGAEGEAA